jgi:DNA-binding transcriptional LysR family regulator
MEPTPVAEMLAEPVSYALNAIHSAVNLRLAFDPATSQRCFTIAMTDIGEIYLLPLLLQAFAQEAPSVALSTVRDTAVPVEEAMESGRIDLATGVLPQLKSGFFQRRLFRQRYVCLFRRGHPLDKAGITLDEFAAAHHVVVAPPDTGHRRADELLEQQGIRRDIRLRVPHFAAIGHILQSSDLVATVPERFAERVIHPFRLTTAEHPAKLPEVVINLFWHARVHKDPANQWLRGVLFKLAGAQTNDEGLDLQ